MNTGIQPLINFNEPQQVMICDEATLRRVIGEEVGKLLQVVRNNTPEPVSRKEALELLHCSEAKLWQMQTDGTLHPIRIGRKVLYDREEINAILQKTAIRKPRIAYKTTTSKGKVEL